MNPQLHGFLGRFLLDYLQDDPEMLCALGLQDDPDALHARGALTIVNDDFVANRIARASQYRKRLRDLYDPRSGSDPNAMVLDWYLSRIIEAGDFGELSYPIHDRGELSDLFVSGVPQQTLGFLLRGMPLFSRQDVFDYLSCLHQVPAKLEAAQDALRLRYRHGITTPLPILTAAIARISAFLQQPAKQCILVLRLAEGLRKNLAFSPAEQQQIITSCADLIQTSLYPAYRKIIDQCLSLIEQSPNAYNLTHRPQGEAYYRHLLGRFIGSDQAPGQLLRQALEDIEQLDDTIAHALSEAGISASDEQTHLEAWEAYLDRQPDIAEQAQGEAINPTLDAHVEALIKTATQSTVAILGPCSIPVRVAQLNDILAEAEPEGYYEPPSCLTQGNAVFHLNSVHAPCKAANLKTLIFHETVPGHHFQLTTTMQSKPPLPAFRHVLPFPGWSEGWATYAESLAHEMGLYAGDPLGNIGRLAADMRRTVRLVVDVGLHSEGWSLGHIRDRLQPWIGACAWLDEEIARAGTLPARGSAYAAGKRAVKTLRESLPPADQVGRFAQSFLRIGPCPLALLPLFFQQQATQTEWQRADQ